VEWDDDLTCWQVLAAGSMAKELHEQKYSAREKNPSLPFEEYVCGDDTIRLRRCHSNVALSVKTVISIGSNHSNIKEMRGIQWTEIPTPETVWKVELVAQGAVPGLADDYGSGLNTPSEEFNPKNDDGISSLQREARLLPDVSQGLQSTSFFISRSRVYSRRPSKSQHHLQWTRT
jgi:hypothetical protein